MKKAPSVYKLKELFRTTQENSAHINQKWVPARPMGIDSFRNRIRVAFMVFKGEADAVVWPENQ